jgi:hypothetical protein
MPAPPAQIAALAGAGAQKAVTRGGERSFF